MNQTEERLISPAAQAGPCVLLVSETKTGGERERKTSAEGTKEDAGSKRKKGKREECHQHFGCGGKERSSEASEGRGDEQPQEKVWPYLLIKPSSAFVLPGMIFKMSELQQETFPFPAGLVRHQQQQKRRRRRQQQHRFQSSALQFRAHRRAALSMNERGAAVRLRHPLTDTHTHTHTHTHTQRERESERERGRLVT